MLKDLPASVAVQGNLAPELLQSGGSEMTAGAAAICRGVPMARHVFNLGHGILQHTPPEHVTALLEAIRAADGRA